MTPAVPVLSLVATGATWIEANFKETDLTHMAPGQPVSLTVGDRTASARITERTPWGSYSVAGVGAPPFTVEPSN